MTRRTITVALVGTLAAGTALVAAPLASAKDREARGNCNTSSRWEAEAESERGNIDIKFEVKTGQTGQKWRYVLKQNTVRVYTNTKATRSDNDDDDGFPAKVEWETIRPDRAGVDRLVMRAVNQETGEICRAVISI